MIVIGSDHGGFVLKEKLKVYLKENSYQVNDVGCFSEDSVHYPQVAKLLTDKIISGEQNKGILVCGTGIGMSIAANRFKEIRAALCHDYLTAKLSREHNNSNVLVLGGRITGDETAYNILDVWLNTEFLAGRHQNRLDMIFKIKD